MTKKIYKYNLGLPERISKEITIEGTFLRVLSIQQQGYEIMMWAEIDTDSTIAQTIHIKSVWTGDNAPESEYEYVDTLQAQFDGLVYHFYVCNPYNHFDV